MVFKERAATRPPGAPAMQLERTRALVAETLARELGVGPGVLAPSRDQ